TITGLGRKKFFQVDRRRRAMSFCGLDGNGATLGYVKLKTHDGLVDTADLLHIKRPVAQAFAVEDEQVAEDAEQDAIRHARHVELFVLLPLRFPGPAFEEGITIRIEEIALARRQFEPAMTAAFKDQPEEREQLGPGSVALIHRVRVTAGV